MAEISIVCFDELGRSPHAYSCTWCYYSKEKIVETKREALLAEQLGSLYSNSNTFVFCFLKEQDARTNTIFKPK
jgi:hypothetical protein